MKLYIVRHGQTESNIEKKLLGITDESMNHYGHIQIINLKDKIKNLQFDVCFSSPFKRTLETANILCNQKTPIIIDNRLKERIFGDLENGSYNNKYTSDFWNYFLNKNDYGVEPLQNLFNRTKEFLEYLKLNYDNKCILIVSHAATIRALHYNIIGFNENTDMLSFKIDNAEILEYSL